MNTKPLFLTLIRDELKIKWYMYYLTAKSMSYNMKNKRDEYCGYCFYKGVWWLYLKDMTIGDYDLFSLNGRVIVEDILDLEKYCFSDLKKINNFAFKLKRYIRRVIDL
jgi:hypothetical protein